MVAEKKQDDRRAVAPVVSEAPLEEPKVYVVTEGELDDIGRSSSDCIICFIAGVICLMVAWHYHSSTSKVIAACVISLIAGVTCLVLAWNYHSNTSKVIERIKNRMPPPLPIPQEATTSSPPPPVVQPPETSPPES